MTESRSCCEREPRRTVAAYFERALRRPPCTGADIRGEVAVGPARLTARFDVSHARGSLTAVGYRASTCATLLACCERLAELASSMTIADSRALDVADLLASFPEIPPGHRDRAALAVRALHHTLDTLEPTGGAR